MNAIYIEFYSWKKVNFYKLIQKDGN